MFLTHMHSSLNQLQQANTKGRHRLDGTRWRWHTIQSGFCGCKEVRQRADQTWMLKHRGTHSNEQTDTSRPREEHSGYFYNSDGDIYLIHISIFTFSPKTLLSFSTWYFILINIKMKEHFKMPIFWMVAEWIKHLCGRWEVESTNFLIKLLKTNLQETPLPPFEPRILQHCVS